MLTLTLWRFKLRYLPRTYYCVVPIVNSFVVDCGKVGDLVVVRLRILDGPILPRQVRRFLWPHHDRGAIRRHPNARASQVHRKNPPLFGHVEALRPRLIQVPNQVSTYFHPTRAKHHPNSRYIYLPTLRRKTFPNRTLSSLLCFTFVYVWHGTEAYILVWAVLNYFGVACENLFATVCRTTWVRARVRRGLSEEWEQRIGCAFASPLLAVSAVSNFFFFAGTDVGNVFVRRFMYGKFDDSQQTSKLRNVTVTVTK